ncbi:MAG: rod shape-determining protein RodA [Deltaproteobacteria bacterium]|jgi:rod shape determining protein RodA|nr:rod shape-determining protein RodA [Deltaproteobacteria bacterium]
MKRLGFERVKENFSLPLALAPLALIAIGLINLYSVSSGVGDSFESSHFTKQLGFATLGIVGLTFIFLFDYRRVKTIAWALFVISIILLVMVRFFGVHAGGATRWLPLGPFRFQPSELTKVSLVFLLAHWFAKRSYPQGLDFKDLIFPLIFALIPFVLILKQPDLGTALHLLLTVTPLFFFVRLRPRVLVALVSLLLTATVWIFCLGGQNFLLERKIIKPYHLDRFKYYLAPEESPNDQGWQIIQAKSAIGSGQILGQGFREGSQQKYGFLPAPETDFAFAALAEEWGFVGASLILLLFFSLFWSALGVVRRSGESFGAYLTVGLISLIFWQMTINIAMVLGIFPVVGIPLPFISYGGSSLFISLLSVAVIANVGLNRYVFQEEAVKPNPEVWERGVTQPKPPVAEPVRRLAPLNPDEPEPYPDHRLPHREPWLKFLVKTFRPPIFPPDDPSSFN